LQDWSKTIIHPNKTIKDAIEILEHGGSRIALVVSKDGVLEGTVTDGDVRRALINGRSLDCLISHVMNPKPLIAKTSDSREELLIRMKNEKILHMPFVNDTNQLCGLETLQQLIETQRYDNPVFLMAGGMGTRLQPLTKETPKPLLNVGSKPILENILEQFIKSGFHNFFISTNFKSEMIKEYFGDGTTWGVSINYIDEDEPLGTAGAIGLLPNNLPNMPIIMMNGDILTKVDFKHLLNFHNDQNGVATMCVREYEYQVPYGVVEIKKNHINNILEKPTHKYFVNAGIYVLDKSLIKKIDGKSKIDMPDFLMQYLDNSNINAFPIYEYWLDIGHMSEYQRANQDILNFI
jgi:dTDP-glucose pyrophosphorylase